MKKPTKLSSIFHDRAPGRVDVPDDESQLEELLERTIEAGHQRWPHLALPSEDFVSHLARQLPPDDPQFPLAQVLASLHLDDLYLACACVHNVPEAILTLERHYLAKLRESLHQPAGVLDDVLQELRMHLLLGTPRTGPQLSTYKGQARLSSWLRVIAVRMMLRQVAPAQEKAEENVLEALESLPAPGPDMEFDLIKRNYRHEFRQALREAFAALSHEQRNLLRFYYINQRTTTALGKLLGVTQPTASRRLADARKAVYEETRRRLQERLLLSSQEFQSLLNVMRSQLDLSLSQLLKEDPQDEDEGKGEGLEPEPRALTEESQEPSQAPGADSPSRRSPLPSPR